MENKLNISCSPGTFLRVTNDETYRQKLALHVLSEQESSYNEIIFSPTESQEIDELSQRDDKVADELGDDKQYWCPGATKLMLSSIEELRPKVGKSIHLKTKGKMYKVVSDRMAEKGYIFNPAQIENKFRGLERQYKKVVVNNKQTGRNRLTCSFESELSQIFGDKRALNPEFMLDSGDPEGPAQSMQLEEMSSDTDQSQKDDVPNLLVDDVPNCSSRSPKKRRKIGVREKVMEKMDEMVEEKKDFHSKILELLIKKNEREEKREKRSEKKLELLEKLVSQNKAP